MAGKLIPFRKRHHVLLHQKENYMPNFVIFGSVCSRGVLLDSTRR